MAIRCQQYEVSSGTLLFDFEIDPSPNDPKSLAERLKEIEHKGNPIVGGQREGPRSGPVPPANG